MKVCFSTLGCPNWTFDEVISTAKDLGFDGVEIRGIMDEMSAPDIPEFSDKNLKKTLAKLDGFPISILTSGACLAVSPTASGNQRPPTASGTPPYAMGELGSQPSNSPLQAGGRATPVAGGQGYIEALAYMNLASKLSVPYVRVMCTNKPELDGGDFDLALENYEKLCELGEKLAVTPLMETNGMFCNSALLKKFMNAVKSANKGVLWDVHHPYRFGGEKAAETFKNIGEFVKHVHVKDSILTTPPLTGHPSPEGNGYANPALNSPLGRGGGEADGVVQIAYRMLGHGDIPVAEAAALLKQAGYAGFISLEWVKRWNKNLEDGGVVFAQFISTIKEYM